MLLGKSNVKKCFKMDQANFSKESVKRPYHFKIFKGFESLHYHKNSIQTGPETYVLGFFEFLLIDTQKAAPLLNLLI